MSPWREERGQQQHICHAFLANDALMEGPWHGCQAAAQARVPCKPCVPYTPDPLHRNYTHRGIIPRAIHQVFREIDMRVDKLYKVQVGAHAWYGSLLSIVLACWGCMCTFSQSTCVPGS